MLLPGTGLPISPGAMPPLPPPEENAVLSGSNLTNILFAPSSLTINEPPPFCMLPSVSKMSRTSVIVTEGSEGDLIELTWRSTASTSWKPLLDAVGLLVVSCLQAWLTTRRTVTGREACGRLGPPMTPKALLVAVQPRVLLVTLSEK
jgi:hypothetical protein